VVIKCDQVELIRGDSVVVEQMTQVRDLGLVGTLFLQERFVSDEEEFSVVLGFDPCLDVMSGE